MVADVRTLITTSGKQASTATDQIVQCFSEAREMGFWLDIEAPDDSDYDLLEHTLMSSMVRGWNLKVCSREMGFWLDIEAPDDSDYDLLEHTFKFHPLTIEDIKHQEQRPKVDEYPDYNFTVIFQALWQDDNVVFREHHLYVGSHYLITVHQEKSPALLEVHDRIAKSPSLAKGLPAFLTYLIIDGLVDSTFPALERLD